MSCSYGGLEIVLGWSGLIGCAGWKSLRFLMFYDEHKQRCRIMIFNHSSDSRKVFALGMSFGKHWFYNYSLGVNLSLLIRVCIGITPTGCQLCKYSEVKCNDFDVLWHHSRCWESFCWFLWKRCHRIWYHHLILDDIYGWSNYVVVIACQQTVRNTLHKALWLTTAPSNRRE